MIHSYLQFSLFFGGFMCVAAVILAVTIKDSSIRLGWKIAAPVVLVMLGCATPYSVGQMMGYAVVATPPTRAELLTWVAHDADHSVDLLIQENGRPRLYHMPMPDAAKGDLRNAAKIKGDGGIVYYVGGGPEGEKFHLEQQDLPEKGK